MYLKETPTFTLVLKWLCDQVFERNVREKVNMTMLMRELSKILRYVTDDDITLLWLVNPTQSCR